MPSQLSEASLAEAIDSGQLFLVYQPKIDLKTDDVVGFEGLVRLRTANNQVVMPDDFIPLAESSSLIGALTNAVLDIGVKQLANWTEAGMPTLSLNLSGGNLDDLTFVDYLSALCDSHGVARHRLILELTETSAMAHPLHGMYILSRLRLKGFHLSIDDFGTGYSSLSQLARLPFSELKIDKSFVLGMHRSKEAYAIVRSTIDLAHNLGMRAGAEGVEDARVLGQLRQLGCDMAQGYYIGKPMLPAEIGEWLSAWQERRKHDLHDLRLAPAATTASIWTKEYDNSDEMHLALNQLLATIIHPLWDLGRKSLIAWRPADRGIEVLMAPYKDIVDRLGECQRLLQGRRRMGDGTFHLVQSMIGVRPTHLALPFLIADHVPGAVSTDTIEQVLRRYGITETLNRAVALFDIVGFSKVEPRHQVSQLNSLECSINTAHGVLRDLGKAIDLARTTTGDGFYIWNREKGAGADLDTYLLTMLVLADNAIARRGARSETIPEIRTCYSVGPHYSYYQVDGLDPHGHDYIVGDVTIGLARMIGKCQPGQVLIGDFRRPLDMNGNLTNSLDFVIKADGAFAAFDDIHINGATVTGIRCYLTGPESLDGDYAVQRFRISDKHGFDHFVFNQKFNIYLSDASSGTVRADALYLGRRHADLVGFDGLEVTLG